MGLIERSLLFSPVTILSEEGLFEGMVLAPTDVLPKLQKHGIGSKLIKEGLRIIRNTSCWFELLLAMKRIIQDSGFNGDQNTV